MACMSKTVGLALLTAAIVAPAAAAQSGVPRLDVSATCRPLDKRDASIRIDTERCLKTEQEARGKLAEEWSQFSAADRGLCTQTARMAGFESYVQLLTCLELRRDVAAKPAQAEPRIDGGGQTGRPLRNRPVRLRNQ